MYTESRSKTAFTLLRIVIACLLAAHGWHRLLGGDVADLGEAITDRGIPAGLALSWIITLGESLATPIYALGRFVFPLSVFYTFVYSMALAVYHAPHGWYTSGTGKDGCEYPVLLVVSIICVGLQYAPAWSEMRKIGSWVRA